MRTSELKGAEIGTMRNSSNPDFSGLRETVWLYAIVVGVVGAGIFFSLYAGARLPPATVSPHIALAQEGVHHADSIRSSSPTVVACLIHNPSRGPSHFTPQLIFTLPVSSAVGWVFTCVGQPAVVG